MITLLPALPAYAAMVGVGLRSESSWRAAFNPMSGRLLVAAVAFSAQALSRQIGLEGPIKSWFGTAAESVEVGVFVSLAYLLVGAVTLGSGVVQSGSLRTIALEGAIAAASYAVGGFVANGLRM